MDLFDKCDKFTAAKEIIAAGIYPYFHSVESGQNPEVIVEGKKMVMVGSNNYLGLTSHYKLKNASIAAIWKYGVGCVGSRFLNGTLKIHIDLEKKLAKFMKKESALLFSTGMQVNLGVISAICGKDDFIITDKYDHASIIDGCRLSFAKMVRFKHNDMDDLKRVLSSLPQNSGKLIVIDGVFSMEGDIADLPSIVEIAKKNNARIFLDDAHGLGVLGAHGRGTAEYFGLENSVDLIMGTFSKSFAAVGGFIAGDERIIHYLKHNSRALIFSASMPPSVVASVSAALDVIMKEPQRMRRLLKIGTKVREQFKEMGYDTGESSMTPIIPIVVGNNMLVFKMWRMLFDRGIFTTPIVAPAVPENRALIRVSLMATHTDKHIYKILHAFEEVGIQLGLIPGSKKRMFENTVGEKVRAWMGRLWE